MKILIAGDFAPFGYRLKDEIDSGNFEILSELRQFTSEADYSILNFEAPVANYSDPKIVKNGGNICSHPNAMKAVAWAGFNMITLANNHVLDFGDSGLYRTQNLAAEYDIDTVGAGKNIADAARILYKKIDNKTVAFINCCETEFSIATNVSAGANPLNPIKQFYQIQDARKNADHVIVIVHGGHEYFQLPSLRMQETYRFFIDAGADTMVNHHQHCFSGYELYNGKPIFYGLGNLCFDESIRYRTELWIHGYMVELNIIDEKIDFKLIPYQQCGDKVGTYILKDRTEFDRKIEELNAIISNPEKLQQELNQYYSDCSKGVLATLEPYSSRLTRGAFNRGWLPSFINRKRLPVISNMINCEAHCDKLKFAINKKLQNF